MRGCRVSARKCIDIAFEISFIPWMQAYKEFDMGIWIGWTKQYAFFNQARNVTVQWCQTVCPYIDDVIKGRGMKREYYAPDKQK